MFQQTLEEFALCDVKGAGDLYQVTMAADGLRNTGDWKDISYLEAIVRAYVTGERRALQLSSGLEDYFLGTYYFNRGRYAKLCAHTHYDRSHIAKVNQYRVGSPKAIVAIIAKLTVAHAGSDRKKGPVE